MTMRIGYRPNEGHILRVSTYWYTSGIKEPGACRYLHIMWRGGSGYHYRNRFKRSGRSLYIRLTLFPRWRKRLKRYNRPLFIGPTNNANQMWYALEYPGPSKLYDRKGRRG